MQRRDREHRIDRFLKRQWRGEVGMQGRQAIRADAGETVAKRSEHGHRAVDRDDMATGKPLQQRRSVATGAGAEVEHPFVASKWKRGQYPTTPALVRQRQGVVSRS